MSRMVPIVAFLSMSLLSAAGIYFFQDPLYYPWLVAEVRTVDVEPDSAGRAPVPGMVKVSFLNKGIKSDQVCRRQLVDMTNALHTKCPSCAVLEFDCLHPPSPELRSLLSNEPSRLPVVLHPGGVIVYESSDMSLAMATCRHSELAAGRTAGISCLPQKSSKPASKLVSELATLPYFSALLALVGMLAAWLACHVLIRYEHLHMKFSFDYADSGPQKVHAVPTPRIGGVSLIVALVLVSLLLQNVAHRYGTQEFGLLLLVALPAFAVGLVEDLTKKVGVLPRLGATMFAALLGSWLLGATLVRLDIPGLQDLLALTPFAVLLTAFAVGGVANAFNIIDGHNGLAGGTAVIASVAMGWVAWWAGDPLVMNSAFAMAGALIGFLAWNWPKGRIFLGDGGAYLVGFWLAELAVILVARNPGVSAWFPLTILIYPIFETLFSIVRRRMNGHSPGAPDSAHLHQLVYRHIRGLGAGQQRAPASAQQLAAVNGRVVRYFWLPNAALALAATLVSGNSFALVALALLFCAGYVLTYHRLSR